LIGFVALSRAVNADFYPFGCKKSSPKKYMAAPGDGHIFFPFFFKAQAELAL
jgi:hypothetical protein